jgi:hypothetical protein
MWAYVGGLKMPSSARNVCRVIAMLCSLTLVTLLSSLASAQHFAPATAENAKQFVGTWKANFQGNPFLTVTLAIKANKLVGTVSHANIEVNKAGELTKAEADDGEDPITDIRVAGDILRITTKSTDGSEDSIQSELRLVAANEADLRVLVPPDVPTPKPWRLQRVAAKP